MGGYVARFEEASDRYQRHRSSAEEAAELLLISFNDNES